ncbi:MAG: sulfotransferase family protein [Planctomycetota bacterium]
MEDNAIAIVTGLPRSGTSMVMQMLKAGGVKPYTDGQRVADDDNPNGYFEHAAVKRLASDSSWIADAAGHSLKVIVPLVGRLPTGPQYRVILVERDLDEVIASQQTMLDRSGRAGAGLPPDRLKALLGQQLRLARQGLESRGDVEMISLDYREAIDQPATAAETIAKLLGIEDAADAMQAAVAPSLYRNRKPG